MSKNGLRNEGRCPCERKISVPSPLSALISPPLLPFICLFVSLHALDSEKPLAVSLIHELFDVKGFNFFRCRFLSIEKRLIHTRSKIHLNSHWKKLVFSLANGLRCKQSYRRKKVPHFASRIFVCKIR